MNNTLKIIWNASLTALVLTLLAGLFILAMPPSYRATAMVNAADGNLAQLRSAELLSAVVGQTAVEPGYLLSWRDRLLDREASAVSLLSERLSASGADANGWVELSVEAADPEIAAALVNAAAREFLRRTTTSEPGDGQNTDAGSELASAEARIVEFRSQHPDLRNPAALEASLERKARDVDTRIRALEAELVEAETDLAIIASGDLAPLTGDAEVRRLLARQQQLMTSKAELSARYGPRHRKMMTLEAELATLGQQIENLTDRAAQRSAINRDKIRERMAVLEAEQTGIEAERLAFDRTQDELNDLVTARDRADLRLRGMDVEVDSSNYSAAVIPDSSLGFGQMRIMMMVFVAGFLLVAGIQLLIPGRRS